MEKQNGKGSKPRPYSVEYEEFAKNWDAVFHKYKKTTGFRKTLIKEQCSECGNNDI